MHSQSGLGEAGDKTLCNLPEVTSDANTKSDAHMALKIHETSRSGVGRNEETCRRMSDTVGASMSKDDIGIWPHDAVGYSGVGRLRTSTGHECTRQGHVHVACCACT